MPQDYPQPYDTAAVRQLILDAFSPQEFEVLCFDRFRLVHEKFSNTQNHQAKVQALIDHCTRQMCFPELLEAIEEHNPRRYQQFISAHSHQAIGLHAEEIPKADTSSSSAEAEFARAGEQPPTMEASQIEGFEDFQFHDRSEMCIKILESKANHIELYGPSGVGKTYLLRHLTKYKEDSFAVYIDLANPLNSEEIIPAIVQQLDPEAGRTGQGMALALRKLNQASPPTNHFLFLFDSVTEEHQETINWIVGKDGPINNQEFLNTLTAVGIRRKDIKLQVVIASRQPLVRATSYHANLRFERHRIDRLTKRLSPEADPIQNMLRELATHKEFPLAANECKRLSDEVYYLTGGHPKCAKLLLFAIAEAGFVPTSQQWAQFFELRVLPVIRQEMLGAISNIEIPSIFWTLSVFRRFDQRLLGILIERKVLPSDTNEPDVSRQARQLRKRLVDTYLIHEPDIGEFMYTMNFTVRHALSLNMQNQFPDRYRAINSKALEIFTSWLQNPKTPPDRHVMSLIELVYHWLKALETDPEVETGIICERLEGALSKQLPSLLAVISEDIRPNYLSQLRARWNDDEELHEVIQRVTNAPDCHERLSRVINNFIEAYG